MGKVLFSKIVLHTGVGSAFVAEALTCLMAVRAEVDMGLTVVTIEGDSMSDRSGKKCSRLCSLMDGGGVGYGNLTEQRLVEEGSMGRRTILRPV